MRGRVENGVVIAVLIGIAGSAMPTQAEVVRLGASADNTLYQQFTGGSNGAGHHLFTGTALSGMHFRGLLDFDIAGAIPAGSTIDSVELTLHMSRTLAGTFDVGLYRVLADWGEEASDAPGEEGGGDVAEPGDATWTHRFWQTDLWSMPGGDFDPTFGAKTPVGGVGFYTWATTTGLVNDVQNWLDDRETAFGWILIGNESTTPTSKRFDTREHPTEAFRPVLTIDFTPVPEPTSLLLGSVACLLALRRRRQC